MAKHVVIALPAYSSTIYLPTFRSLLHDITVLLKRGDEVSIIDECGSAYIDDTRAYILSDFLKTDGTELVYVDHDLVWEAGALVKMVDAPVDMCAAVYRKRCEKVEYPVRLCPDKEELWSDPGTGLLEVAGVGFGLVKCSRSMLGRVVAAHPELEIDMPDGTKICAVFEPIRSGNLRLHEDFAFCERWRQLGGKVWADPEVLTAHIGVKPFVGHWGGHLRAGAKLTWKHCLGQIAEGKENQNTFHEMIEAWGNGNWAVSTKMLGMIIGLARVCTGPIIEFGSGLSTVVMRAATDQPITTLEQDGEWAKKVASKLTGPIHLIVRELEGKFYQTDDLPENYYSLAVCDGPYSYTTETRMAALPVLERVLKSGGMFVIDDLQIDGSKEALAKWADGKASYELFESDARTFAVGRMK